MSLTALNSYGVSDLSSAFMVAESTGSRKMSLDDITRLGVSDYGAMFTLETVTGIPADTDTQILCDSISYDNGDFTDANSIGVFYIKSDNWEYVQAGASRFSPLDSPLGFTIFITINSYVTGGGTPDGFPVCEVVDEETATDQNPSMHLSGPPLPVSSGDTFEIKAFSRTNVATIAIDRSPSFWIRGIKRRG